MLDETLSNLEAKIRQSSTIQEEQKADLLRLLSTLKAEVGALEKTHTEHAESVVGFTHLSTHEATRQHKNPHLTALALQGLASSVEELEASHPQLVAAVNAISVILSNIGI